MSIGTGAAIALGASAVAGHLVQAKLASNAANKAAKLQVASADRAIPVLQDVYRNQMAGMQPYANLGASSASTLGRLMSPGRPYTPALQQQDAQSRPMGNQAPAWQTMPGAPRAVPRRTLAGSMSPSFRQSPEDFDPSANPAPGRSMGGGGMVTLRGPDGSTQAVPAAMADQFIQRGAVRV